jgi:acetylornithine deacetylase/succinyl-diaminopimelate desuccinylase-like protein
MTGRGNLPVDVKRLWADLMALAEITEPDHPYTRRSFSPRFLEGRAWLAKRFEDAGLAVTIDAAGNLIGRMEGATTGSRTIMVGSHSDTVPSGGRVRCASPADRFGTPWRSSTSSRRSPASTASPASEAVVWSAN